MRGWTASASFPITRWRWGFSPANTGPRPMPEKERAAWARGLAQYLSGAEATAVLAALDAVAAETRSTPARVALAWLMARPSITAPIASASRVEQMEDLVKACALEPVAGADRGTGRGERLTPSPAVKRSLPAGSSRGPTRGRPAGLPVAVPQRRPGALTGRCAGQGPRMTSGGPDVATPNVARALVARAYPWRCPNGVRAPKRVDERDKARA